MGLDIYGPTLYFLIRGLLQVWIPRGTITIKKARVVLGIVSLPLVSLFYLSELTFYITNHRPGGLMLQPMPVEFFLVWIVFLVTDTLYQFHTISKIPKSNTE